MCCFDVVWREGLGCAFRKGSCSEHMQVCADISWHFYALGYRITSLAAKSV